MENNIFNWENPNIYENFGCILQISGIGFDADAFLEELKFPAEKIRFKGIPGTPKEFRNKPSLSNLPELPSPLHVFEMSNLLINVSEATDLSSQIEEAILFFRTYLNDLKKITFFPGIEDVNLSFNVELDKTLSEFQDFPLALHELAAETGIKGISYGELNRKFKNSLPK